MLISVNAQDAASVAFGSGGAMRWAGCAKSRRSLPSVGTSSSRQIFFKHNFPVTVKIQDIRISNTRMFYCDALTWLELLTDLQIFGCELHKNVFSGLTRWGSYGASPDALAVVSGRGGRNGEGKGWE